MADVTAQIAAKLGLSTTEFKAALSEANAEVKKFAGSGQKEADGFADSVKGLHKGMREFKELLAAGGMVEVVKAFFEKAIAYADKHKEDIDDNTEAVRRFGHTYEGISDVVGKASVQVLGFLNRAGEAWGNMIAYISNGGEKAMKAIEVTESAERNMEEIAKRREETKKEIEETDRKITEAVVKQKEAQFDVLTPTQKVDELLKRIAETETTITTTKEGSLEHEKAKLELVNLESSLTKASAEEKKKIAEEEKKTNQQRIEDQRKIAGSVAEEVEFLTLQEKVTRGLATGPEKDRYEIIKLQRQERADDLEITKLAQKAMESGLTPAEQKRLDELVKQRDKLDEQLKIKQALIAAAPQQQAAEAAITDEYTKQVEKASQLDKIVDGFTVKMSRMGQNYQDQSTANLQSVLANLQKELAASREHFRWQTTQAGLNPYGVDDASNMLQNEVANVQAELKKRRDFSFYVGSLGQKNAQQFYGEDTFQKLMQTLNPDVAKKQAQDTSTIATILTNVFPAQARGFR